MALVRSKFGLGSGTLLRSDGGESLAVRVFHLAQMYRGLVLVVLVRPVAAVELTEFVDQAIHRRETSAADAHPSFCVSGCWC